MPQPLLVLEAPAVAGVALWLKKMITSVGTQHVLRTIGSAAFIIFFEAVSLLERQDFHKDSQFFASA